MENRCVVCGCIIPEGLQVCPNCQETYAKKIEHKPLRTQINWELILVWSVLFAFCLAILYWFGCGAIAVILWLAEVLK